MFRDRFSYPARLSSLIISTVVHLGTFGASVIVNGKLSDAGFALFLVFTLLLAVAWVRLLEERFVWSGGKAGQEFYADAENSMQHWPHHNMRSGRSESSGVHLSNLPKPAHAMDDEAWQQARETEQQFLAGQQANHDQVLKEFAEYVPSPDPSTFSGPGAPGTVERTPGGTMRHW